MSPWNDKISNNLKWKWQTAVVFKIEKIAISAQRIQPISTKCGLMVQNWFIRPPLKTEFFKIQNGGYRLVWRYLRNHLTDFDKIWHHNTCGFSGSNRTLKILQIWPFRMASVRFLPRHKPVLCQTANHRITQTTPHDKPGSLVFCCQRSLRNSTGVNPYGGGLMQFGWVIIGDFRQISGYISKTAQDRCIVSIKVE